MLKCQVEAYKGKKTGTYNIQYFFKKTCLQQKLSPRHTDV